MYNSTTIQIYNVIIPQIHK